MIRALFLDVDGTLISFRTHEVPASALEALHRAHARGVRLFIATGRAVGDLAGLEEIPYDGVVALNGADCLMRDGEVVARHLIPRAEFEQAMALSAELDFPVGLELNDGIFVNRVTPVVEEVARLVAHPVPEVVDLRRLFDRGDCCQMCFYVDPELEKRVMARLPSMVATRWCPIFTDVNLRGIDKATGMAEFAERFGSAASTRRPAWRSLRNVSASAPRRRWPSATAETMSRCCGPPGSAWPWAGRATRRCGPPTG